MANIKRDMLIGMDWMYKINLTIKEGKVEFNILENQILEWLNGLEEVFRTIPERELSPSREGVDHEITLINNKIKPSLLIPTRPEEQQIVKEYLDEMMKKEWIRPSKSPIAAFLFLISKPGTNKKRPVIDYRKLNEEIVTDSTPLSLIGDMMDQMKGQKYFTKVDLKDAFNQIRIKERDEWKTAFRTRYETFEYLVMSFELVNVPVTFQRFINQVLQKELDKEVLVYMDDIFTMKKTKEEHRERTRRTLEKLLKAGLRIKLSKSEFEKEEVKFLRHIIGKGGIKLDPEKVRTLKEWSRPTRIKEVQGLMGFANYYRKLAPGLSEKAYPLNQLLKKGKKWEWEQKKEKSFQQIIKSLSEESKIRFYNPELLLTIETDALDHITRATLM